jgi:hypothetical protein
MNNEEEQAILCQALEAIFTGQQVNWPAVVGVANKWRKDFEIELDAEREEARTQTRLLREIVELLARPDGLGGKRAVQRVRRRVRKQTKTD